jgi:hypothetical protein
MIGCTAKENNAGLRELSLTICDRLTESGAKVLDVHAAWVRIGLMNLKSLRSLDIIIASDSISYGVAGHFKQRLEEILNGVKTVVRTVRRGILLTLL